MCIDYLQKRRKRDLNLPLLSQQDAKTMFEKRMGRPVKQGIVCECCKHQCSMKEMVEYCNMAPPQGAAAAFKRRDRTPPKARAKKWISAPDVVRGSGAGDSGHSRLARVTDDENNNSPPSDVASLF